MHLTHQAQCITVPPFDKCEPMNQPNWLPLLTMGEERPEDEDRGGITKKAKKQTLPKPPGMSWKCYDEHVAQDLNISKAKARRDRKVHGHGKQMLNNE